MSSRTDIMSGHGKVVSAITTRKNVIKLLIVIMQDYRKNKHKIGLKVCIPLKVMSSQRESLPLALQPCLHNNAFGVKLKALVTFGLFLCNRMPETGAIEKRVPERKGFSNFAASVAKQSGAFTEISGMRTTMADNCPCMSRRRPYVSMLHRFYMCCRFENVHWWSQASL